MMSWLIREMRNVVGLVDIWPCMDWLKVYVRVCGNVVRSDMASSFHMEHKFGYSGCHVGGAGCSRIMDAPVCIAAVTNWSAL